MAFPLLRLTISPSVGGAALDELRSAGANAGRVLVALHDLDVGASALTVEVETGRVRTLIESLAARLGGESALGSAFRFELLSSDVSQLPTEEDAQSLTAALGDALAAPASVAQRTVPVCAWASVRAMPWGRKGLAIGNVAPVFVPQEARHLGVALEMGAPTLVVKARLEGVPEHGLMRACRAVGGPDSGFGEVGAYAALSATDDASLAIVEFGNVALSPIHRALDVLDIESRRYGGRLGACALLSHIPLDSLLAVLAARIGLGAQLSQILETHLPTDALTQAPAQSAE